MKDNLFTLASKEAEASRLAGFQVGYYEEGVLYLVDFKPDEMDKAEDLMHEKGGWMTGIRKVTRNAGH